MYQAYIVKEGETLSNIANQIGIKEDLLRKLNGFNQAKRIMTNEIIVIPITNKMLFELYDVKPGDTIYGIAKKYNIDYHDLLLINGLDQGDYIYPDQELLIPAKGVSVYVTKPNDTILEIANKLKITQENLVDKNATIYVIPDQILIYKEKEEMI